MNIQKSLAAASFSLALLTAGMSTALANPTNGPYGFDGNGSNGTLQLAIDSFGNVSGSVYGNAIFGFYNANSSHIVFERVSGTNPQVNQTYFGYYWHENCTGGQTGYGIDHLAGSFLAFAGSGGSVQRNQFGWNAQATYCHVIP